MEIIPETSKLNLNAIPDEELLRCSSRWVCPRTKAFEITAAILDWRTPVDPESPALSTRFIWRSLRLFCRAIVFY